MINADYTKTPPVDQSGRGKQLAKLTESGLAVFSALEVLAQPGQVVELRILKYEGRYTKSGYFNDITKLALEAQRLDREGKASGIYITLNPVKSDLLARANNRVKQAEDTTTDSDVLSRFWLPIDFDPVRSAGISSSDNEHQAAIDQARACGGQLKQQGWPEPILADSGNGAHLLYRIDLPNDQQSAELLKAVLAALANRFDAQSVKLDTKVFNAARIWKLYGTLARKGDSTPERPHRQAKIIYKPEQLQTVSIEQLQDIAGTISAAPSTKNRPPTTPGPAEKYSAYVQSAFDGESQALHGATQRNNQLNSSAYSLGQLVGGGYVDRADVETFLHNEALAIGLSEREIEATIKSGIEKGIANPRQIPEKRSPAKSRKKQSAATGESGKTPSEQPGVTAKAAALIKVTIDDAAKALAKKYADKLFYDPENDKFYLWNDAYYEEQRINSTVLERLAKSVLTEMAVTINRKAAVTDCMYLVRHELETKPQARLGLINFSNGTYDAKKNRLRKHDRQDGLTYCLPYQYSAGGKYPGIERFLRETMPDEQSRLAFMAHIGLALLGDTGQRKSLLLIGRPATGKSRALYLANAACGNETRACAGAELFSGEAEGMRSRAKWNGRRMVAIEELPAYAWRDSEGVFKAMTAHSGVSQRHMYRDESMDNVWIPKLIMAANEQPRYADRSGALTDRLVIVECPNQRPEGERDPRLLENDLLPEIPYFVPECIKLAKQVEKTGVYPMSEEMKQLLLDVEVQGDSVKSFVSEYCSVRLDSQLWALPSVLFASYKTYCDEAGLSPLGRNRFLAALRERYPVVEEKNGKFPGGYRTPDLTEKGRFFVGISLKINDRGNTTPPSDEAVNPPNNTKPLSGNNSATNFGATVRPSNNGKKQALATNTTLFSEKAEKPREASVNEKHIGYIGNNGFLPKSVESVEAVTNGTTPMSATEMTQHFIAAKMLPERLIALMAETDNAGFALDCPLTDDELCRIYDAIPADRRRAFCLALGSRAHMRLLDSGRDLEP